MFSCAAVHSRVSLTSSLTHLSCNVVVGSLYELSYSTVVYKIYFEMLKDVGSLITSVQQISVHKSFSSLLLLYS